MENSETFKSCIVAIQRINSIRDKILKLKYSDFLKLLRSVRCPYSQEVIPVLVELDVIHKDIIHPRWTLYANTKAEIVESDFVKLLFKKLNINTNGHVDDNYTMDAKALSQSFNSVRSRLDCITLGETMMILKHESGLHKSLHAMMTFVMQEFIKTTFFYSANDNNMVLYSYTKKDPVHFSIFRDFVVKYYQHEINKFPVLDYPKKPEEPKKAESCSNCTNSIVCSFFEKIDARICKFYKNE